MAANKSSFHTVSWKRKKKAKNKLSRIFLRKCSPLLLVAGSFRVRLCLISSSSRQLYSVSYQLEEIFHSNNYLRLHVSGFDNGYCANNEVVTGTTPWLLGGISHTRTLAHTRTRTHTYAHTHTHTLFTSVLYNFFLFISEVLILLLSIQ